MRNRRVLSFSCVLIAVVILTMVASVSFAFSSFLPITLPDTITLEIKQPVFPKLGLNQKLQKEQNTLEKHMNFLLSSQRAFSSAA